jgi:hypothetical protein
VRVGWQPSVVVCVVGFSWKWESESQAGAVTVCWMMARLAGGILQQQCRQPCSCTRHPLQCLLPP